VLANVPGWAYNIFIIPDFENVFNCIAIIYILLLLFIFIVEPIKKRPEALFLFGLQLFKAQ